MMSRKKAYFFKLFHVEKRPKKSSHILKKSRCGLGVFRRISVVENLNSIRAQAGNGIGILDDDGPLEGRSRIINLTQGITAAKGGIHLEHGGGNMQCGQRAASLKSAFVEDGNTLLEGNAC